MIHIYTGDGKGKSTAAFGVAIRMLGHKKKVALIQFMKKNPDYGEIRFFEKMDGIEVFQFGTNKLIEPGQPSVEDVVEAREALSIVFRLLNENRHNLIIIDEINVAVAWGLIELSEQKKIFSVATKADIIMTGRSAHPDIIEMADLVTEMKEIKHYYKKNIKAKKGIEF